MLNEICSKCFKPGVLNPLSECEECAIFIPKLLLLHGGTADGNLLDILKAEGLDQSIVIYERTYENRDMSTYVVIDKEDLFLRCRFIKCTNTDYLLTHDCEFIG